MIFGYSIAFLILVVGVAVIPLTFIEATPVRILYHHYLYRKTINWLLFAILLIWILMMPGQSYITSALPVIIAIFGLVLTYKLHPESVFSAIDYPIFSDDYPSLPIDDNQEIAVVEYEGITKCYPLDYVIHHHIINDHFDAKIIALTYCAMCRSVIPFDVTDLGPLSVAALKNGNMVMADRRTKTFFQQSTFSSMIGPLHPSELTMVPFQVLTWSDVKSTLNNPAVVNVIAKDFKPFELPIPGAWKKIMSSEFVPGVSAKRLGKEVLAHTRIVGLLGEGNQEDVAYIRKEVLSKQVVTNQAHGLFIFASTGSINAYKNTVNGNKLKIKPDGRHILDGSSGTRWDVRGKYVSGSITVDLEPVMVADEYWFSWKKFKSNPTLIRL